MKHTDEHGRHTPAKSAMARKMKKVMHEPSEAKKWRAAEAKAGRKSAAHAKAGRHREAGTQRDYMRFAGQKASYHAGRK